MNDTLDRLLEEVARDIEAQITPHLASLQTGVASLQTYGYSERRIDTVQYQAQQIEDVLTRSRGTVYDNPDYDAAAASLIHDIRQSLFVINGHIELIQTNPLYQEGDQLEERLQKIHNQIQKIHMWLHIDRQTDIRLREIIKHVQEFCGNHTYTIETALCEAVVHVIPSFTIRRVFQAVNNAIKAQPDGALDYTIRIACYTENQFGVIAVEDTGIGINPDTILTAAYEAGYTQTPQNLHETIGLVLLPGVSGFKQTKKEGNGIGLTSSALALKRGEKISIETTIEREGRLLTIDEQHPDGWYNPTRTTTGTTFRFYFPLAQTGGA